MNYWIPPPISFASQLCGRIDLFHRQTSMSKSMCCYWQRIVEYCSSVATHLMWPCVYLLATVRIQLCSARIQCQFSWARSEMECSDSILCCWCRCSGWNPTQLVVWDRRHRDSMAGNPISVFVSGRGCWISHALAVCAGSFAGSGDPVWLQRLSRPQLLDLAEDRPKS